MIEKIIYFFQKQKSVIKDKTKIKLVLKVLNIKQKKNNLRIFEALMQDKDKNTFEIKSAYIDTRSNILVGENIIVNLNNIYFNESNEPRLKGKKIKHGNNTTEISKGTFSACKKTDSCPPWQLSAEKITHDSKKKSII